MGRPPKRYSFEIGQDVYTPDGKKGWVHNIHVDKGKLSEVCVTVPRPGGAVSHLWYRPVQLSKKRTRKRLVERKVLKEPSKAKARKRKRLRLPDEA